jgi:pyruvate,orthophosphate dikinase
MNRYAPLYIGTAGQSDELTPELAGSKAALIWQMTRLGLNVPPAFVLPTELCAPVNRNDPQALAALDQALPMGSPGCRRQPAAVSAATARAF